MKAAIIGLGCISVLHRPAIALAGGELVAVCDNDKAKLDRFAAKGGKATMYTDYRDMLAREQLDVVHICTPHYLHAEMIIDALRAGCNVLCEKPLCIREEDIDRILAAEAESGRQLAVCHQNRYNQSSVEALRLISESPAVSGFGYVVWNRDAAYYASGDWRGKWDTEGGGVMINQALHTLDLMLLLMGDPDTVQATCENRRLSGVIEVEDTASALFRYADGRMFNFYASNANAADFPVEMVLRTADKRTLTLTGATLAVDGEAASFSHGKIEGGKSEWGNGHEALISDFYSCIRENRPFPINGKEGARVVRAILGMYRSNSEEIPLK
ncbi:MAG: Gfo/Idh/MocA family oxidoreductase [Clostridia bacterium]|nr:Gfo/Idh/MocA family oxidoreductase [Clostridia bacterium]